MSVTIDLDEQPVFWTLRVVGDLDHAGLCSLRITIDRILAGTPTAVVADLSGVDYLDSSGLGLLLVLYKEYVGTGRALVLVTNQAVETILSVTRLSGVLATAPDMETALEMLDAGSF